MSSCTPKLLIVRLSGIKERIYKKNYIFVVLFRVMIWRLWSKSIDVFKNCISHCCIFYGTGGCIWLTFKKWWSFVSNVIRGFRQGESCSSDMYLNLKGSLISHYHYIIILLWKFLVTFEWYCKWLTICYINRAWLTCTALVSISIQVRLK